MPTFTQIGSAVTVGSGGAATISFTSIPNTYTDLVIKASLRSTGANSLRVYATFNSSTSNFTAVLMAGDGSTASAASIPRWLGLLPLSNYTASTFGNMEVYIPNYLASINKSYSSDAVTENNATQSYIVPAAGLWSNTAALTSITLVPENDSFAQHSTAYLYGVSNA